MTTTVHSLPTDRIETDFLDFKPALSETEAINEANRCINCFDAPCIRACPTAINIPQFIARIGTGNTRGSAKTILDSNIFGLSCAQSCPTEVLCEGACVYNSLDKKPISIGKLQRFAVEHVYKNNIKFYSPGKPSGKRIALVGAGPASLACAHELRKYGHETIVYEKASLPGGLNTHGIAPYKMRAETSLREIKQIQEMGIEIRYDQELGGELSINSLLKDYDAVFLGMGLGPDSRLEIPGREHTVGAVEFISKLKTSPKNELKNLEVVETALVVGAGNTALDACRELKKLGLKKVLVSYRRGPNEMSGYTHEFKYARQEGVEFLFHTIPAKIEPLSGQRYKATFSKTAVTADGVVQTTGEETTIDVDFVLVATGQSKLEKLISAIEGIRFERGKLQVNSKTGQTGNKKIFAGGDLVNGGMEVVNAVAEGKRAAFGIHEMIGLKNG